MAEGMGGIESIKRQTLHPSRWPFIWIAGCPKLALVSAKSGVPEVRHLLRVLCAKAEKRPTARSATPEGSGIACEGLLNRKLISSSVRA